MNIQLDHEDTDYVRQRLEEAVDLAEEFRRRVADEDSILLVTTLKAVQETMGLIDPPEVGPSHRDVLQENQPPTA